MDSFTSGWSIVSGNASLSFDGTHVQNGDKSLKVTSTGGALSDVSIAKNVYVPMAGKNKQFTIKMYIPDPNTVRQIRVYFYNDVYENNGIYMDLLRQREISGKFAVGWNHMPFVPKESTTIGSFDWNLGIQRIKIVITQLTSTPFEVILDSILYDGKSVPKILVTFDDGWKTVYENAFPVMKELGIPGTIYAIPGFHSNPNSPLHHDFCTPEQLKEMKEAGWTIGNHTWGHDYYIDHGHTIESYVTRVRLASNWLKEQGFGDDANYFCFPAGQFDQEIIQALKEFGIKTARPSTRRGINPHDIDTFYETSTRNFSFQMSLQTGKNWIDYAIDSGGTTFLQFHQIPLDDTTSNGNENPYIAWSKDKFEALMYYIAERGAVQYCVNNKDWYEGMENPRMANKVNRFSI